MLYILLHTKTPHKINHVLLMMQLSGFENLCESLKKKLLELHLLFVGFLAGTGGGLFTRIFWKQCHVLFVTEILLFRMKYFSESNCDAFDDSLVDMLSPLGVQFKLYKKARISELGKTSQYWLIYLVFMYLQIIYKKMI